MDDLSTLDYLTFMQWQTTKHKANHHDVTQLLQWCICHDKRDLIVQLKIWITVKTIKNYEIFLMNFTNTSCNHHHHHQPDHLSHHHFTLHQTFNTTRLCLSLPLTPLPYYTTQTHMSMQSLICAFYNNSTPSISCNNSSDEYFYPLDDAHSHPLDDAYSHGRSVTELHSNNHDEHYYSTHHAQF